MSNQEITSLVFHWAIVGFLNLFLERARTLRDDGFSEESEADAVKYLDDLRAVLSNSVLVDIIDLELKEGIPQLLIPNEKFFLQYFGERIDLAESLNFQIQDKVKKIASSDAILREFFSQKGNLINALEAARIQRSMSRQTKLMTWLTVVILGLTLVTVVEAIFYSS